MRKAKGRARTAEMFNSITHGFGAILALAGLVILLVFDIRSGPGLVKTISLVVYGISLVLLFSASSMYHAAGQGARKLLFQKLDHAAIYILIAGTYTPFTLVSMGGAWGWTIFGIIWGLALAGIGFQVFFYREKYRRLSALLYLAMGWMIVVALGPLLRNVPAEGLYWLLAGGLFYSSGVWFYIRKSNPYNHVIWHLFVLAGAISHFVAVFRYV